MSSPGITGVRNSARGPHVAGQLFAARSRPSILSRDRPELVEVPSSRAADAARRARRSRWPRSPGPIEPRWPTPRWRPWPPDHLGGRPGHVLAGIAPALTSSPAATGYGIHRGGAPGQIAARSRTAFAQRGFALRAFHRHGYGGNHWHMHLPPFHQHGRNHGHGTFHSHRSGRDRGACTFHGHRAAGTVIPRGGGRGLVTACPLCFPGPLSQTAPGADRWKARPAIAGAPGAGTRPRGGAGICSGKSDLPS